MRLSTCKDARHHLFVTRYQLISYIDIHVVASKVSSIQFLCFGQGIRSLESIYAIICEIIPSLVLMMRMDLLVHDEFRRKKYNLKIFLLNLVSQNRGLVLL